MHGRFSLGPPAAEPHLESLETIQAVDNSHLVVLIDEAAVEELPQGVKTNPRLWTLYHYVASGMGIGELLCTRRIIELLSSNSTLGGLYGALRSAVDGGQE